MEENMNIYIYGKTAVETTCTRSGAFYHCGRWFFFENETEDEYDPEYIDCDCTRCEYRRECSLGLQTSCPHYDTE
jgi:hypothetical protein